MSRSSTIRVATATFLALTWATLLVRCWVRIKLVKMFGIDDKWMIAAQVFYTIFTVITIKGTIYGFGKHTADLSPSDVMHALEFWWIGEITYSFATAMAKIAICLFLLRIVYQRVHKWILYATMAVSTLWSFCFVFITIFQCSPPSYYWNRNQPGHCLSPDFIINSSIAYGVISMATDFTIGILPIFVVRHLQMNIRSKCAVVGILAMAAVASAATVIRFPYLKNYRHVKDLFWELYGTSLWTNVEPGLGITAANLATMRPLLQAVITNVTHIASSQRTPKRDKPSSNTSQQPPSNEHPASTQAGGAHIAHHHVPQNGDDFALFSRIEAQRSESNVNTWHSNSDEELMRANEDIELSGPVYWKSEVAVTEESVNKPIESWKG